ncbi:MAG: 50S ribosomal protein L5 [Phycisphaeraceae bacterium]
MKPRLKEQYDSSIAENLKSEFGIENPMAMPRLEKIILNVGMGKQLEGTKINTRAREQVLSDLTVISGQKPIVLKAKKSVSNFKVREGYEVGAMVTLRRERMWEFLDRLITLAIPRIKDFRGLSPKSFDGRGNYSFGVNEQGIFPEVDMTNAQFVHGLHVTLVFRNSTDEMSRYALQEMGFPFTRPAA